MKQKIQQIAWFLLRFNILVLPFYILLNTNFSILSLQMLMADILRNILALLGYDVAVSGVFLGLASASTLATVEISMDCTGIKSMYTLFALVVATPIKKKRSKFLLMALPLIFLVNFLRVLAVLVLSLKFGLQYLNTIHVASWYLQIVAISFLWYFWLKEKGIILGKHKILFR